MDTIREDAITIQPLHTDWYGGKVARMDMLRLDLIHPRVSGNKWYKLQFNIQEAMENGKSSVVTFGGGHSNHLIATAHACKIVGLKSLGIVRGHYSVLTQTLLNCEAEGMELCFAEKAEYDALQLADGVEKLLLKYPGAAIIPEGGANESGRRGAALIGRFIRHHYTHIALSVGSGTTFAGLRNALPVGQSIIGFAPMKGGSYLQQEVGPWLISTQNKNWEILDKWHFGGFGKSSEELVRFMNQFYQAHRIPLDFVYTAKMMFGVQELLDTGYFNAHDIILCIHTGGLQGNASLQGKLAW